MGGDGFVRKRQTLFDLCKIAEHIAAFFERQIQYGGMWIGQCLVNRYGFDVGVLFQCFDGLCKGRICL